MSETQFPFVPPPPPIWQDPRLQVELFAHPLDVQTLQNGAYLSSLSAKKALDKPWQPGKQQDNSSVAGQIRLTLPKAGLWVFVGRGRGALRSITVDGAAVQARWLGLDSVPSGSAATPKGWHPFVLEVVTGTTSDWNLNGLRISGLSGRFAG